MSKAASLYIFFLVAGLMILGWGCAGPTEKTRYVKDGKEYGTIQGAFRHRWWHYYARGISFMEGAFYAEAIADFKAAIEQREKDQRMARTYGMHFVDYFPHRELGIVFLEIENFEQAKTEMEFSLAQYPTAKARFYMNRIRQALIRQENIPVAPPIIRLDVEDQEFWTRDDPVILSGVVEDENFVARISIQDVPLYLEGSQKQIQFKEKLRLPQGRHRIIVVAENLGGITAQRQLIIHVDREGPLITLEEIGGDKMFSGQRVTVKGSLYDGAGIGFFSINGVSFPVDHKKEVFFAEQVVLQNNLIEIVARDVLGNETLARITVKPGTIMGTGPMLLANSVDTNLSHLVSGIFGSKDQRPPELRLEGWADRQTVYLEKIYLEGQVADESKIVALTVNDVPVLRRAGRLIVFGYFAELKEGDNLITIRAEDEAGNESVSQLMIRRDIPLALRLDQRLSVSVMPFEQKGQISSASLSFQDNLINALVRRNRFRVVERQLLETILQEQNLSRTKLVDRGTALKLGQLAAAHSIITGSLIESRQGVEIIARFIDTETAEILDTEDVYGEVKDLLALKNLSQGLALKIHRRFPLVGGIVIQKKGNTIITDMGEQKIGIQKRLIVYREEPVVHPVTGKVLGADSEILGRARIKQISPEMSKAELIEQKGKRVDRLDKVITE